MSAHEDGPDAAGEQLVMDRAQVIIGALQTAGIQQDPVTTMALTVLAVHASHRLDPRFTEFAHFAVMLWQRADRRLAEKLTDILQSTKQHSDEPEMKH